MALANDPIGFFTILVVSH